MHAVRGGDSLNYPVDITMFLYTDLVDRLVGITFAWFLGFDI